MKHFLKPFRYYFTFLLTCALCSSAFGSGNGLEFKSQKRVNSDSEFPISKFSLSLSPLGFLQFGPWVNAEFGLSDNLVLNTHLRFPSLGVLAYIAHEVEPGDDSMSGLAIGGGPILFLSTKQHKPYVGLLMEYDATSKKYNIGESWEQFEKDNIFVFMISGGYRFRFNNGFYLNTGALLGAAYSSWNTEYVDQSYYTADRYDSGTSIIPFGMLDLTIGIEF